MIIVIFQLTYYAPTSGMEYNDHPKSKRWFIQTASCFSFFILKYLWVCLIIHSYVKGLFHMFWHNQALLYEVIIFGEIGMLICDFLYKLYFSSKFWTTYNIWKAPPYFILKKQEHLVENNKLNYKSLFRFSVQLGKAKS
jgi:hypothetical protein